MRQAQVLVNLGKDRRNGQQNGAQIDGHQPGKRDEGIGGAARDSWRRDRSWSSQPLTSQFFVRKTIAVLAWHVKQQGDISPIDFC